MRIVIATAGSLGDLHPYLALALALKAQGAEVVFATSADHQAKVEGEGLTFRAVGPDIPRLERELGLPMAEITAAIMRDDFFLWNRIGLPYLEETVRDLVEACRGADAIVAPTFGAGAPIVADLLGIRWIAVAGQPFVTDSDYDPFVTPKAPWMRPTTGGLQLWLNRSTMNLARKRTAYWRRRIDEVCLRLGAAPARSDFYWDVLKVADLGIGLFTPLLAPRQPDWPEHFHVVGDATYDREVGGQSASLSPELERFLARGPEPIAFTLGSFAVWSPSNFYRESLAAARRLGRRAVLLVGPEGDLSAADGPDAIAVAYAPFSLLMPRVAAIVHQGGIGTTHQALRSGRPQLIVPHLGDQFDNAERVRRLGCGAVMRKGAYRAPRVARRLKRLLARAGEPQLDAVARRVREENGADEGARVILDFLNS